MCLTGKVYIPVPTLADLRVINVLACQRLMTFNTCLMGVNVDQLYVDIRRRNKHDAPIGDSAPRHTGLIKPLDEEGASLLRGANSKCI